jgi:F-type H+-transporting ATPase subunit gamma
MPSIKDLKKRIGTVKNTQQTTRAMKMVSAAKLRRAQEAISNQRPFANRMGDLIRELTQALEGKELPLIMKPREKETDASVAKKVLVVVVTSDRGLCGGFNANVIKATQRWLRSAAEQGIEPELAFVGRKGHEFFRGKKQKIAGYFPELGGKVTFAKARKLSDIIVSRYTKGEVDEVKFIFNEFKNAVTQKVNVENFLPVESATSEEKKAEVAQHTSAPAVERSYIIKPSPAELLEEVIEKNFSIQTFRILLESQAGEHGARMSAMENATKNAGEMIRKLALQYNKQRQAGITKELLEIISGSESQKG